MILIGIVKTWDDSINGLARLDYTATRSDLLNAISQGSDRIPMLMQLLLPLVSHRL